MVGVLAVSAAALEEYTVQPCKKQRKEEDPQSKTITNYFSPLSKAIDRGLASPKSSNIADYFIRTPPAASKQRTPSTKTASPRAKEYPSTPPSSKPPGRAAKQGKRTRLLKRLGDAAPPSDTAGNGNPANRGIMGSETAALLAEICSHTADLAGGGEEEEDDVVFQSEISTRGSLTSPQGLRTSRNTRRLNVEPPTTNQGSSHTNVSSESKTSVGDSSLEVQVGNTSDNLGTLTISFEDFMKSQESKEESVSVGVSSDGTNAAEDDQEAMQLPSPKTVTILAQVHLSPPLQSQNSTKIASIFKKSKADKKKAEAPVPECEKTGPVASKRKSNVVIEEEDLELAVIDVEAGEATKPKSTPAERQQFMKVFQQAGEASRAKAKKNPTKRKDRKEGQEDHQKAEDQPPDKAAVREENEAEETEKPSKLKRRKKKKTQPPNVETPKPAEKEPSPPAHSSPVLRRSLRRQRPSRSPQRTAPESPVLMSTPKVRPPCRENDVYRAEVLTVPSDVESPIRMRFTRVTRNKWRRMDSEDEVSSPGCKKVPQSTKKISKAKQLLEKAKAIQQNIVKAEAPERRATRQRNRVKQEPVVVADITSSHKDMQKTATLRSLNDVLGKKMKTKSLPSGLKKDVKKKVEKGGVITIDDSPEVSENSQDDEQCKAKRNFLMSGLPDSLKRQIAKTTAIMEAYSVSGSSFQTVVHVQQRHSCTMWSLAVPCCRLLTNLSPLCSHVPDISQLTLDLGDFTRANSKSAAWPYPAVVPKRLVFSSVIQDVLLEEIRLHNPQFPVRRFFKQFLKKQNDYFSLQDANKSATQQPENCLKPAVDDSSGPTGSGAKRKRKESPCSKSKRRKPSEEEPQCETAPTPQLPRSSRRKKSSTIPAESEVVLIVDKGPKPPAEDAVWEDVLWTEKYQPQNSNELIGNSAAIRRLHSWLREWKIRAEKEEKRNQMQKSGKDKDDTWSAGDFHNSEDSDEDSLCNTVLISGPPGVGKTAAVYACAQELGFKVFEVNASCQRSGRQILAQLKEATQSHQVDQQGVNAHKPCFFSSSSTRSPRKLNSPKRVVSSPRKPPASPRGTGLRKGLPPKSLANFFKAAPKQKLDVKRATAEPVRVPQSSSDGKVSRPLPSVTEGSEELHRKTATSLILFEEVDVIFDDDIGFLSAVKTFMSTTKRPVILTTSDPMFRMTFDGAFEEIFFHIPSVVNVASFLQVLCLAENLRTDTKDLMTFLTANRRDIRQSILHLQFWARSGGGVREKPLPPPDKVKMEVTEMDDGTSCTMTELRASDVPGCNVGCAENLLGVNSILAPTDSLISFLKEKIPEAAEWDRIVRLLTEFQSRNISFTYSNLEYLLPLPVHIQEPPAGETLQPADDCLTEDIRLSTTMRRRRKLVLLNDSDLFDSDFNPLDEALDVKKDPEEEQQPVSSEVSNGITTEKVVRRTLSPAERKSSLLVYQCLDSMAEFADHMSSLDCSTCDPTDPAHTHSPSWTESRLKHGLCDGLRTESRDCWRAQSCGEIRALMEALSFHKCSSKLSKSLESSLELCKLSGKDPTEELTLRVTKARDQVNFGEPAATTDIAQRRLSVVRDVLSHRAFTSLGSRDVNVTEYLPTLRTICRLQKEKEEGKTKRRFLHYLEGIHLELPKGTLSSLAADFP
ncbi:ATPase family AAA domain-containing protein 5 [Dendropsophus ebraccatus]|uniref:ATPase family AAA domain-containing protein 5 n=1 Tax=Dendropsophus ebraccatus TaxID=150705 RepID=UPI003831488A